MNSFILIYRIVSFLVLSGRRPFESGGSWDCHCWISVANRRSNGLVGIVWTSVLSEKRKSRNKITILRLIKNSHASHYIPLHWNGKL
jgi:hypothetical protein